MTRSERQSSITSSPPELDHIQTPSTLEENDSSQNLADSELAVQTSFQTKIKSGLKWLIDPFVKCCSSTTNAQEKTKSRFDSTCLKPEFNRVNGLLKFFTFGIMFTNGMLGFILFIIGLWSSFEQRKLSHIPPTNTNNNSTSINPFSSLGIILCIFGLLFFLLCLISCLGINRENLNLLRLSLFGQFLTLILFITVAVLILIWGEKLRHKIGDTLMTGLRLHYHIDKAWTAFFDRIHLSYFCCGLFFFVRKILHSFSSGVYSFNDWNDNLHYACTSSNLLQSLDACSVPFTCCKTKQNENNGNISTNSLVYTCGANVLSSENQTIDMNEIQERIHVNGCFDEILPVIHQLITTSIIFLLLICIIIFITIFLTCLLIFEIRLTRSDIERYCRKKTRQTNENDSEKF